MVLLPLPMRRRLAIVNDDGDSATGNKVNDDGDGATATMSTMMAKEQRMTTSTMIVTAQWATKSKTICDGANGDGAMGYDDDDYDDVCSRQRRHQLDNERRGRQSQLR